VQVEADDVGPDMGGAGDGAAELAVVGDALATAGASMPVVETGTPDGTSHHPSGTANDRCEGCCEGCCEGWCEGSSAARHSSGNTAKRSVVADSPSLVGGQSGTQRLSARSKRLFEQSQCTRPEAVKTKQLRPTASGYLLKPSHPDRSKRSSRRRANPWQVILRHDPMIVRQNSRHGTGGMGQSGGQW
jgi:hypothetical protein